MSDNPDPSSVEAPADARLAHSIEEIRNEMRDRIQSLLEEQRICLRQLSLQATEEEVRADRGRRETSLRLEELARRVDELARAVERNGKRH